MDMILFGMECFGQKSSFIISMPSVLKGEKESQTLPLCFWTILLSIFHSACFCFYNPSRVQNNWFNGLKYFSWLVMNRNPLVAVAQTITQETLTQTCSRFLSMDRDSSNTLVGNGGYSINPLITKNWGVLPQLKSSKIWERFSWSLT